MRVLVLGGYGVFGGLLVRLLIDAGHEVLVAGRHLSKARAFCNANGGHAVTLPDTPPFWHQADLVVDATGPFQAYEGYERARSILQEGAHYLDLSDDADFVAGVTVLNSEAMDLGLVALSGVSTVPAVSAAAANALTMGLSDVALISTALAPGNKAPRGRAVMASILAQVGTKISLWRGRRWTEGLAWTSSDIVEIPGVGSRRVSPIGAPDLKLFHRRYGARSVLFRAGLELDVMHFGLLAMAWLVRLGVISRLERLTDLMRVGAGLLQGFGTDSGGMVVKVGGRDTAGKAVFRRWWLCAREGLGPVVPAVPAAVLVEKISIGQVAPGARPCLDDLTLENVETALAKIPISTHQDEAPAPRLFEAAIGERWQDLPEEVRTVHDLWDQAAYEGRAEIERGSGLLSRLVGAFFRFPAAGQDVSVRVDMRRIGDREVWVRRFGGKRFSSVLSPAEPGQIHERFGVFRFRLGLPVADGALGMPVEAGSVLGVPIPMAFLPISETREFVEDGRFRFDVSLSVPFVGFVVRYRGWLQPLHDAPDRAPK